MTLQTHKKGLQGPKRKVVFVTLYELIAIAASSLLFMAIGQSAGHSGGMAIAASTLAIVWNLTFNHLFEQWEARQSVKGDRKSTRLNSSHLVISYAVFCLKKKNSTDTSCHKVTV